MNLKEIKELSKLMDEKQVVELEIEETGLFKTKIIKSGAEEPIFTPPVTTKSQEATCQEKKEEKEELAAITSPLVGTFFRASAPKNPPYIEVGDNIEKGQIVGNIVAMKTQNEVKSELSGKIVEALVENSHPVEYGQDLFLVRLSESTS